MAFSTTFPDDDSHRLQGDIELVRAVRATGPDSTAFRYMDETLFDYVMGTLMNLNATQTLRREVRRQCRIPLPSPPRDWGDHSRRVIFFSARTGVDRFMDSYVIGGKWDHRKGASVKTSAVRRGLYSFADEYRIYLREETGKELLFGDPVTLPVQVSRTPLAADPAVLASQRDFLNRLLVGHDEFAVAIFGCVMSGMKHAEIADELDTDVETVDREWRSIKNNLKKRLGKVTADDSSE
ncbi:hypothetical protein [Actinomycetospora flava]|uniref:DNA-directed RNA polymerase specialized sigma24 family protein n=1 Tax=Actinomycetospora flava TaxID=3129232 RepID=A0ABU8MF58_9PSEU